MADRLHQARRLRCATLDGVIGQLAIAIGVDDEPCAALPERARSLVVPGRRHLPGSTGSPGSDRPTLTRPIQRHVAHGKTPAGASRWVLGTDARNAVAIAPARARADLVVALPAHPSPLPPPADPEAARCSG